MLITVVQLNTDLKIGSFLLEMQPPTCDGLRPDRRDRGRMPRSLSRSIRDVEEIKAIEIGDKSTEVFSGLYVNEPSDVERESKYSFHQYSQSETDV